MFLSFMTKNKILNCINSYHTNKYKMLRFNIKLIFAVFILAFCSSSDTGQSDDFISNETEPALQHLSVETSLSQQLNDEKSIHSLVNSDPSQIKQLLEDESSLQSSEDETESSSDSSTDDATLYKIFVVNKSEEQNYDNDIRTYSISKINKRSTQSLLKNESISEPSQPSYKQLNKNETISQRSNVFSAITAYSSHHHSSTNMKNDDEDTISADEKDHLLKKIKTALNIYNELENFSMDEAICNQINYEINLSEILFFHHFKQFINEILTSLLEKNKWSIPESTCYKFYYDYMLGHFYCDYTEKWFENKREYNTCVEQQEAINAKFQNIIKDEIIKFVKDIFYFDNIISEILFDEIINQNLNFDYNGLLKKLDNSDNKIKKEEHLIDNRFIFEVFEVKLNDTDVSHIFVNIPIKYILDRNINMSYDYSIINEKEDNHNILKLNCSIIISAIVNFCREKEFNGAVYYIFPSKKQILDRVCVNVCTDFQEYNERRGLVSSFINDFNEEFGVTYSGLSSSLSHLYFRNNNDVYDDVLSEFKTKTSSIDRFHRLNLHKSLIDPENEIENHVEDEFPDNQMLFQTQEALNKDNDIKYDDGDVEKAITEIEKSANKSNYDGIKQNNAGDSTEEQIKNIDQHSIDIKDDKIVSNKNKEESHDNVLKNISGSNKDDALHENEFNKEANDLVENPIININARKNSVSINENNPNEVTNGSSNPGNDKNLRTEIKDKLTYEDNISLINVTEEIKNSFDNAEKRTDFDIIETKLNFHDDEANTINKCDNESIEVNVGVEIITISENEVCDNTVVSD